MPGVNLTYTEHIILSADSLYFQRQSVKQMLQRQNKINQHDTVIKITYNTDLLKYFLITTIFVC